LKIGPVQSQTTMIVAAVPKAHELPDHSVTRREARSIAAPIFDRCAFVRDLRGFFGAPSALMRPPGARREPAP
jgi:hypothetical protein